MSLLKCDWDDILPVGYFTLWAEYYTKLDLLSHVKMLWRYMDLQTRL